MRRSGRLIGFSPRPRVEDFRETRFVKIAHGGFTIWLDPFGMLGPQVFVHLFPQIRVRTELVKHNH